MITWSSRETFFDGKQIESCHSDNFNTARRWRSPRHRRDFSPDLHTGTGNFTVPIALPPGRNGFQPQLNLVYSTGNGNGPFGLGWSLSIPGVSRKTSRGIPRYATITTPSCFPAPRIWCRLRRAAGVTRYRPRTEGLFARIEHRRAADTDHWEVRSKDGLVSVYGTPRTSRTIRRSSPIRRIEIRSSIGSSPIKDSSEYGGV